MNSQYQWQLAWGLVKPHDFVFFVLSYLFLTVECLTWSRLHDTVEYCFAVIVY